MNHGKFAESPQIVQLIGQRLAKGQTLTGGDVGLVKGATAVIAGTAGAVGTATSKVVTAPMDAANREKRQPKGQEIDGILNSGASPNLTN
jgi:esterase/lipase superfamily enzyme